METDKWSCYNIELSYVSFHMIEGTHEDDVTEAPYVNENTPYLNSGDV